MELGTSSHFLDEELALSHLRKESLDLYNRIHSIFEDVAFVNEVRASYPQLPVIREYAVWLSDHDSEAQSHLLSSHQQICVAVLGMLIH